MNLIVFPNQLFEKHPGLKRVPSRVVLIEDSLFFGDHHHPAKFHKQKLWLHRATMKRYEAQLHEQGFETLYIDYDPTPGALAKQLARVCRSIKSSPRKLMVADPTDFILEKRLQRISHKIKVEIEVLPNPGFLNSREQNIDYRAGKKRWFMADFYKFQRRRLNILMDDDEPIGGRWSFDEDNRKKVPKKLLSEVPAILKLKYDPIDHEAVQYVHDRFPDNPGQLEQLYYPTSRADAKKWLRHFLKHRFGQFGIYEDAIVRGESWLWHSVLTPALNVGLLTPDEVVKAALAHAKKHETCLLYTSPSPRDQRGSRMPSSA